MITYRTRWLTRREVWFGEAASRGGVDVLIHMQSPDPVPGVRCEEFSTLVIDLARDPEQLLDAMPKNTRYEIRRAESKDGIEYEYVDAREAFEPFCAAYDEFAAFRKLPCADRIRLRGFLAAGALDLSRVRGAEHGDLTWHAYCRHGNRARLLLSASLHRAEHDTAQRSLMGRANRYHHWRDMLRFKEEGVTVYDLGGWYAGGTDPEMLGINRFKEGFGGEVVVNYTGQQLLTFKARFAAILVKLRRR